MVDTMQDTRVATSLDGLARGAGSPHVVSPTAHEADPRLVRAQLKRPAQLPAVGDEPPRKRRATPVGAEDARTEVRVGGGVRVGPGALVGPAARAEPRAEPRAGAGEVATVEAGAGARAGAATVAGARAGTSAEAQKGVGVATSPSAGAGTSANVGAQPLPLVGAGETADEAIRPREEIAHGKRVPPADGGQNGGEATPDPHSTLQKNGADGASPSRRRAAAAKPTKKEKPTVAPKRSRPPKAPASARAPPPVDRPRRKRSRAAVSAATNALVGGTRPRRRLASDDKKPRTKPDSSPPTSSQTPEPMRADSKSGSDPRSRSDATADSSRIAAARAPSLRDHVCYVLRPLSGAPRLDRPAIRSSRDVTVRQLAKHVRAQLERAQLASGIGHVDILCGGVVVAGDLSVGRLDSDVWRRPRGHLTLEYRCST